MMSDKCKKKRLSVDYNTMQQIAKKANASVSVYIKAENETAKKLFQTQMETKFLIQSTSHFLNR